MVEGLGPEPPKTDPPGFFAEGSGGGGKNRGVAGVERDRSMGGGIFLPSVGIPLVYLVRLDITYLCTKFESSSLCHSLDMDGGRKFKMGDVT